MELIKIANELINKEILKILYDHFCLNKKHSIEQNYIKDNFHLIDSKYNFSKFPIEVKPNYLLFIDDDNFDTFIEFSESKLDNNPKNKDILSEGYLDYYDSMPKLNFQIFKKISTTYNKSYQGYEFLKDALIYIFKNEEHYFDYIFNNFIKRNKSRIDRIMSSIEIKPPKKLGEGATGVAFLISEDKVLKIFTGTENYKKIIEAINNLHQNNIQSNYEPMTYDAGRLGKFYGIDIYFSITEKLNTSISNSKIRDVIIRIKEEYNNYINIYGISDNLTNNELDEIIDYIVAELSAYEVKSYYAIKQQQNINDSIQDFIKNIVLKISSDRIDLHEGNLGVSNKGNIRYFDSGYYLDYENRRNMLITQLNKIINSNISNKSLNTIRDFCVDIKNMNKFDLIKSIKDGILNDHIFVNGIDQYGEDLMSIYEFISSIALENDIKLAEFDIINSF